MSKLSWQAANGAILPTDLHQKFTITTPPKTDIWRPESTDDVFTAPYIYTTVSPASFQRLTLTVSGPWKTTYDQGGFIIAFPRPDGPWRWIKAGIEFLHGAPELGVVGTDRFSDWSLAPMAKGEVEATFEAVREGRSLWVYAVRNGARQPLREIKWAFLDFDDEGMRDGEVRVGVYAAKPTPEEGDAEAGIEVTFTGLELETAS